MEEIIIAVTLLAFLATLYLLLRPQRKKPIKDPPILTEARKIFSDMLNPKDLDVEFDILTADTRARIENWIEGYGQGRS